jgi:EmrB/QacA subfamily drug resistance transporter
VQVARTFSDEDHPASLGPTKEQLMLMDLAHEREEISARAWQTLFITSISIFLVAMDVTIVGVALPGITESFADTPTATLAWVFTGYNVTFAALLLLSGKLADRLGRKPTFLAGLATFAVASLLAAAAPTAEVLIAARVLQAVGSALIYPASLALLLPQFPISRRSMALGVWGGIAGLGAVVAPTLGALLVEWAGWRAVFFVNLPFVIAASAAGAVVLRDSEVEGARDRFDPVAVPLAALAIGLLVLGIVQAAPWGWGDPRTIACFAAAVVLLVAFVRRSAHHPAPLLDLALFRIRSFTIGNIVQVVASGPMFGWLVLMPTFFARVWGWSPLSAGFGVAPVALIGALLSPPAGRLADRIGHRALVAGGCAAGALGTLWWVLFANQQPNYLTGVLPGIVLAGLGATGCLATATGALMSRVPPRFYSMAGAARTTIFQLGLGVGIAVAVSIVDAGDGTTVGPYRVVWCVAATSATVAGLVMVLLFPQRSRPNSRYVPASSDKPEGFRAAASQATRDAT